MMYQGTLSPIFDVPEFPTLRRVKPLPKRRRTGPGNEHVELSAEAPPSPSFPSRTEKHVDLQTHPQQTSQTSPPPLDSFIPPELLSRVDNPSTRMTLQNYYLPILGNVQNFLATHGVSAPSGDGGSSNAATAAAAALAAFAGAGRTGSIPIPPLADVDSIEFGVHFAAAAAAAAAAGLPMGGLSTLGMGLEGINMHLGQAGADDGKVDTSIGRISPSPLCDVGGLGTTREYGSSPEGSSREDDYHGRRPGNTKKRKIPANLSGSSRGLGTSGDNESPSPSYMEGGVLDSLSAFDGGVPSKTVNLSKEQNYNRDRDSDLASPPVLPPPSFPGQLSILIQKKGKLTAATLAGLQHKERLKARKRQLAAVLGALSHGDTMALDQALTFSYSFASHSGEPLKVRKSKRRTVRLARAMNILMQRPDRKHQHPDAVPFPESDFTFRYPSLTADRLITTKEEVVKLRKRFETELQRQAGKAAKLAVASSDGVAKTGRAKRERRERERDRAARAATLKKAKSNTPTEDQIPQVVDSEDVPPETGLDLEAGGKAKSKTGKKKKRSALANASNPHHLRNYVPSRLPHSGPVDGSHVGVNNIWPLPIRFLAAETPAKGSRSHRKADASASLKTTRPAEEWICAFCEYDLFYGDDAAYRTAVRKRKKILRRRRKAAERVAAASSGGNTTTKAPPVDEACDKYDEATRSVLDEHGNVPPQRNEPWKDAPDKEPTAYG